MSGVISQQLSLSNRVHSCPIVSTNSLFFLGKFSPSIFIFSKIFKLDRIGHEWTRLDRIGQVWYWHQKMSKYTLRLTTTANRLVSFKSVLCFNYFFRGEVRQSEELLSMQTNSLSPMSVNRRLATLVSLGLWF